MLETTDYCRGPTLSTGLHSHSKTFRWCYLLAIRLFDPIDDGHCNAFAAPAMSRMSYHCYLILIYVGWRTAVGTMYLEQGKL